ncbi:MAG: bifunctional diaminohydroxyphosphoribosylaminopyrimidine deaminase/5-amino-6-(5-phosphoribosylamino)uracil reductase RibD [Thermoanaerobacterales bacterium]|nr:bifunctional diaminohydroxyphosphoribosylaminopyrimidine deaminase/5-amino-6-(5-phosphoribosylamino)uracil reductase RibD [Bacillota bacterium]MDI6907808.1 bifunctional diaminohydroxyphosphoribosylaminopyrimidine deaminase/5-amino-6-(5-phosphoribosylamino)uracil reductase RibD [Thermoanaerobacterales bacterium]
MDTEYMRMALELAARARGRTSPNPMVGAVVVHDGQIVGRGFHARAGLPHAEVEALREAGEAARGATLYVTLEPCCHHGRTGPCTEAVIASGVRRVVAGMRDPNPLVAGHGLARLREAGIEVTEGVLAEEAARLNEVFIKFITTRRPFVVVKAAVSLDGKIATHTGDARWVTSAAARSEGHRLRDTYDAILVGIGTVLADDPSLTTRLPEGGGRDPVRVILDSRARTPVAARVLRQESAAPTVIAVTELSPPERRKALEAAGAEVWICGSDPQVDLDLLLARLAEREITSVLVEGGSSVNASFLEAGLVDKVVWFIAPKIIGGREAPGAVGGRGPARMAEAVELERVQWRPVGEDLCCEGYLKKKGSG